jgi:hypothetical protein
MTARAPFWSDDFDMDLLKLLPNIEAMIGDDAAATVLFTHGHVTHGRLNHPASWNTQFGPAAFFGFQDPAKPEPMWTSDPVVECTWLEVLRDCWSHSYAIVVERRWLLPGESLQSRFMELLGHVRGYARSPRASEVEWLRRTEGAVLRSTERMLELRNGKIVPPPAAFHPTER